MNGSLQKKSGKYYVVFRKDGEQKWIKTGIDVKGNNLHKAQEKMNEILYEYSNNPEMFNNVLFTTYIRQWLNKVEKEVDTITYKGYEQYATKHIIPYFEPLKLKLKDVTTADIEGYYNNKAVSGRLDGKEGGLSYRTIKLHSVTLNRVFKYAKKSRLIKENPCIDAEIPRNAQKSEKKSEIYTSEQCKELLKIIKGTPLYDMVYISFMYGLRRSELMGLKWSAVDFENNKISICHTVVLNSVVIAKDKTKTESSKRNYPLTDSVKEILLRLKAEQEKNKQDYGKYYNDTDYIFVRDNGKPFHPSYASSTLGKVLSKNNLPHIRWHDLRHSCATMLLLEKGWNRKEVSDWLGHSSTYVTENIYSHITEEHKNKRGAELNSLLIG